MPLMLFLAIFARESILVVFGEKWLPATNVLRILAITSFIEPALNTVGTIMLTCGKSRKYLTVGVVWSVVTASSYVAGVPWGVEGIALGRLAITWLTLVPFLLWIFKDTPIDLRLFASAISRPGVASLLMAALLYNLKVSEVLGSPMVTLMVCGILMPFLYFSFFLLIPGGRAAIRELWTDLASAFESRNRARAHEAV
jgi:PST family polysaccharide transporter